VRVNLRLDSPAEWIKVFDPREGAIFLAAEERPAVGDQVRVDLTCGDGGPRVILRGEVVSHRDEAPVGYMVALGPTEREKVNYLNGFVRGGLLDLRENRRLPLRLPVTYGGLDGPCQSFTRDINDEGVFVLSEEPLPEDAEVHLLITVPGRSSPLSVVGVVSHTVVVEDEDVPGMGIVFRLSDAEQSEVTETVDSLEKSFLSGDLPEEILA